MKRHAELVLECARGRPDAGAICALASGVDWPAMLAFANKHDLQSLCFWRLHQVCSHSVPPDVLERLRTHFRENAGRNLMLTGELFRILTVLDSDGVPVAAFKGPVTAWSIYENPATREYTDLDLLVDRKDVRRVAERLDSLGYRPEAGLPAGDEARLHRYGGQMVLIREAPRSIVDLHWELAPPSLGLSLSAASLWTKLRACSITGRRVLTFDLETQLTLSAIHGGKHGWTTLAWLADIAAIIERTPLDWDRAFAEAREMRSTRALYVALCLAGDLLRTPIPPGILKQARSDRASTVLANRARADWIDGSESRGLFSRKLVFQLKLTEGRGRQALLLWRKLTEPNVADWDALRVRPSIFGFYWVARPCRLALKYVRLIAARLWTAVCGNSGV